MAFKKRKANGVAEATAPPENKRQRNAVEPTASSSRPSRTLAAAASPPRSTRSSISARSSPIKPVKKSVKSSAKEIPNGTVAASTIKKASKAKSIKRRAKGRKPADFVADGDDFNARPELEEQRSFTLHVCRRTPAVNKDEEAEDHDEGPSYWLMKAEPDSRIEKGKDVKFSIDDLNAATEPAGWDGKYFVLLLAEHADVVNCRSPQLCW